MRVAAAQLPDQPEYRFEHRLVVVRAPQRTGETIVIGGHGSMTIGRSIANAVIFIGNEVSRQHCRLTAIPGGWRIENNRSKNGILVNWEPTESHDLQHGDLVRIGEYEVRFRSDATTPMPPEPVKPAGIAAHGDDVLPYEEYDSVEEAEQDLKDASMAMIAASPESGRPESQLSFDDDQGADLPAGIDVGITDAPAPMARKPLKTTRPAPPPREPEAPEPAAAPAPTSNLEENDAIDPLRWNLPPIEPPPPADPAPSQAPQLLRLDLPAISDISDSGQTPRPGPAHMTAAVDRFSVPQHDSTAGIVLDSLPDSDSELPAIDPHTSAPLTGSIGSEANSRAAGVPAGAAPAWRPTTKWDDEAPMPLPEGPRDFVSPRAAQAETDYTLNFTPAGERTPPPHSRSRVGAVVTGREAPRARTAPAPATRHTLPASPPAATPPPRPHQQAQLHEAQVGAPAVQGDQSASGLYRLALDPLDKDAVAAQVISADADVSIDAMDEAAKSDADLKAIQELTECPSCGGKRKSGAILCINCGFNFKAGLMMEKAVEPVIVALPDTFATRMAERDDEPDRVTEWYFPLTLLGLGLLLGFAVDAFGGWPEVTLGRAVVRGGVGLMLRIPMMIVGVFVAANIFRISYGPLTTALVKLIAIVTLPGFALEVVRLLMMGDPAPAFLLGHAVAIALYWMLLGWLFKLEPGEVWWTILVIWPLNLIALVLTGMVVQGMFG